jgi:hypothetical protein
LPLGPCVPLGPCGPCKSIGVPVLLVTIKASAGASNRKAPVLLETRTVLGTTNPALLLISIPVGLIANISTLPLWTAKSPVTLLKVKSIALPFELSINSRLPDLGIILTFLAIDY